MGLTQEQYDALKLAFDSGILDHDALAKEALKTVLLMAMPK
ncbi:hypothetical protein AB3K25_06310 [Leuconostoc sp. MS02]|uniref:Uncharacterized protein n=1 Tax=Leuconostoc aquikimchii TaxID=3236804 RepID=A0ABV3S2C1_9LACO